MAGQFYARGAALVPPHQGSHLPPPPLTHTLQLHRGDTMYLYSSRLPTLLTVAEAGRKLIRLPSRGALLMGGPQARRRLSAGARPFRPAGE